MIQAVNKNDREITLRVSAKSNPSSVAGSIAKNIQEGRKVHLSAIGAGAVNQMVKGYAIARGFVAPSGMNLLLVGGFEDVMIGEDEKTGLKFTIVVQ